MRQVLATKPKKTRPRGKPRQCFQNGIKKYLNQVDETARIKDLIQIVGGKTVKRS